MSLPRYSEYKDSSQPWLGQVPSHWALKRLRFAAELNPSKAELAEYERTMEVSFLPMEAIGDDGSLNLEQTRTIAEVESGYTFFRNGDVTIAKITPCFENGKGLSCEVYMGGSDSELRNSSLYGRNQARFPVPFRLAVPLA